MLISGSKTSLKLFKPLVELQELRGGIVAVVVAAVALPQDVVAATFVGEEEF